MELLKVHLLRKYFDVRGGKGALKAVDGIDFLVEENSILALVGESGCGKSTVARLALRLIPPTSGNIFFRGNDIWKFKGDSLKDFRRSVQIIFQDPFASLNPRKTVFDTISEPFKIHRIVEKKDMREACIGLLKKVGMGPDVLNRYPHEFSGGQRQRICIARVLTVSPKLIVADEPLSALDVSIQAQILNLLHDLKKETRIAFLFISHDLKVVHYFSDTVAVMYLGKIVEYAKTEDIFREPMHPYTVMLLSSVPEMKPHAPRKSILKGEVPSPIRIPPGCPFHPRCPRRFEPCDKVVPVLKQVQDRETRGRLVSCHLWNP